MGHIWEDALTFVGSTADAKPATRESVRDDEKPWLKPGDRKNEATDGWQGVEGDGTQLPLDSWVAWYFTYTTGADTTKPLHASYVVGTNIHYPNLDGAGAKFAAWTGSRAPLERFIDGTIKANDRLDPAVFGKAATNLTEFTTFLDGWITKIGTEWVKGIGEEDGDWQGSSANALRALLLAFRNEIDADNQMIRLADVSSVLTPCKTALDTQIAALWKGFQDWWASPLAWPTNTVSEAIKQGLKGATVKVTAKEAVSPGWAHWDAKNKGTTNDDVGTTSAVSDLTFTLTGAAFGDPATEGFWTAVDKRAREIWVANVVKVLDKAADDALTAIGTAYGNAGNAAVPLKPFPLIMPDPKTPTTDDPTKDKDPTKDGPPDIKELGGGPDTKNLGGGPDIKNLGGGPDIKDIKDAGGGGGGGTGGNSGGGNKPNLNLGDIGGNSGSNNPNLNLGGGGGNLPNLNLGNGGSGNSGSNSGSGPNLIGNPFPDLGTGPLPDSLLPGSSGSNRPVVVPPTSVITKDGRIVDESGNPVLDAAGNPMVAGPGYSIGPDGVLRDGQGNTVSQNRQLLADRYSAAGDDSGGPNLLSPNSFGAGGFSYNTMGLGAGGSGSGSSLGLGGGPMMAGMGGGLSNRALAAGGDPSVTKAAVDQANAERVAAERAARAAAQEQAALTGQRTATSSGGMPPMMPPGGGMGGGAGGAGNEKDRRRTTWLAEDEEVWGTDSGAVSGVIGR
ncbi:hypothetical protein OG401_07200 [Kitasatospora purpeofusca]|uniref:hypothetical protein n=1 Tax=Kitasatospora purpeofusca TaxID=67352 RepID=UPI00225824D2|nr:hypothetical protein [Kitasatospora purpeofusca]MCX4684098.1 hypothetical protein [Kitasatospora purpeofusca]